MMETMDQLQTRTTGSRETSIKQVGEISTEKDVMAIMTEDQILKTVTEALEGDPTGITIPITKMVPTYKMGCTISSLWH